MLEFWDDYHDDYINKKDIILELAKRVSLSFLLYKLKIDTNAELRRMEKWRYN